MKRRDAGLGIIEVLVAMALMGVLMAFATPSLIGAIAGDAQSRERGRALAVADSWLDRYRAGQEPLTALAPCTGTATAVSCVYARGRDFAQDSAIISHVQDAAKLNAQMAPFASTLTLTLVQGGQNGQLWNVRVQVAFLAPGGSKTVEASSYVAR